MPAKQNHWVTCAFYRNNITYAINICLFKSKIQTNIF